MTYCVGLLVDTGLVFDFVNDRTLAVTLENRDAAAGSATAEARSAGSRHAQSAETQSVAHEAVGSNELSVDPRTPDLEEVTITGTHVRGEQPIGAHLISLARDEINSSGAATVPDFLRTLLNDSFDTQADMGDLSSDLKRGVTWQNGSKIGKGAHCP